MSKTLNVDKERFKGNSIAANNASIELIEALLKIMEQAKQERRRITEGLAEFKVETSQQFSSVGREIALVLQAIHELLGLIQDIKSILKSVC